jgi:hypothetical protein
VVVDAGALNYLVLTGDVGLLARLLDKVLVPEAVRNELAHPHTPALVREWIAQPPDWLEVRLKPDHDTSDRMMAALDHGERAAIAVKAGLVVMDDREGVAAAPPQGSCHSRHAGRARYRSAARHDRSSRDLHTAQGDELFLPPRPARRSAPAVARQGRRATVSDIPRGR